MKGSKPGKFFKHEEKIGKLFIKKTRHTVGNTLQIFVLPSEDADYTHPDAVEGYGIISGNKGWDEVYGWIHQGPWVTVFEKIFESRKQKFLEDLELEKQKKEKESLEAAARKQQTLAFFGIDSLTSLIEKERQIFENKIGEALTAFLTNSKINLDEYDIEIKLTMERLQFRVMGELHSKIHSVNPEIIIKKR